MKMLKLCVPAVLVMSVSTLSIAACGGGHDKSASVPVANSSVGTGVSTPANANTPVATVPTGDTSAGGHHRAMAGAAAGAVAGHMLGGHAIAGAAVGALVQHERNKHQKY